VAGDGSGSGEHYARIDFNYRDGDSWIEVTCTWSTQLTASLRSDLGHGLTHTLAYEFQDEEVARPYWVRPCAIQSLA